MMTGRLGKPYISGTGALHNGRQSAIDLWSSGETHHPDERKLRPGGTRFTPQGVEPQHFWTEWLKSLKARWS